MARSGDVFSEKAGITREYAPFRGEVLVIGGGGGGGGAVGTCYHERVVVLRRCPKKPIPKEETAYNQVSYPESRHLLRRYSRAKAPSQALFMIPTVLLLCAGTSHEP